MEMTAEQAETALLPGTYVKFRDSAGAIHAGRYWPLECGTCAMFEVDGVNHIINGFTILGEEAQDEWPSSL